jgi:hypothetical protein
METNELLVQRSIDVMNRIVPVALDLMKGNKSFIKNEFMRIFYGESKELISHLIAKWDKDFAGFYLNLDEKRRRRLFGYYHIPLEPDKYPDSFDLNMALIKRTPKKDVFPFESYIVNLYYMMAYNNSLELLKDIVPDDFIRIKKNKINLFGNGLNWSKAWSLLSPKVKESVVNYILVNEYN